MKIFGLHLLSVKLIAIIIAGFLCYEWIFRSINWLMQQFKPTRCVVECIKWPFVHKLKLVALLFSTLMFAILFEYQGLNQVKVINFSRPNVDMATVYGTIFGLTSMYGIYLGFLQFAISDFDKAKYLGKNKIKYLTESSIWYQVTHTKLFFCLLAIMVTFPLVLRRMQGEFYISFLYAWQTSIFMLIYIYLFLIILSLKIISILFLVKSHTDMGMENRIEYIISKQYQKLYKNNYINEFDEQNVRNFFSYLKNDLINVEEEHICCFFEIIFGERMAVITELNSSAGRNFFEDKKHKYVLNRYKAFLQLKWSVINKHSDSIPIDFYKKQIEADLSRVKRITLTTENAMDEQCMFLARNDKEKAEDYLFDQLLNKYTTCGKNLTNLTNWINEQSVAERDEYTSGLEEYRWKEVFNRYLTGNYTFQVPRYLPEAYSSAAFDYVVDCYDNFEKLLKTNDKYQKLIDSMNEVDRLAAIIYVFLYPKNSERLWVENWKYLENVIEELIRFKDDSEIRKLIQNAGKKIDETFISHRINSNILMELYKHKSEVISSMSDFEMFDGTKMSKLFILFIEGALDRSSQYNDRIILKDTEQRFTNELCINYLFVIDSQPDIVKSESIRCSMNSLLKRMTFNKYKYEMKQQVGMLGLLYFEYVKSNSQDFNTKKFFVGLAKLDYGGDRWYFTDSVFNFFTLKLIDSSYRVYFENSNFLQAFKFAGIRLMDRNGLSLDRYVETMLKKITTFAYTDMGEMSMEIVKQKLRKIMFE